MTITLALAVLTFRLAPVSSGVAYRQPQLAAGEGIVALTFGAGTTIYFAGSRDGGKHFSPPVKVAESGTLALGRHRGPRVVISQGAIVISAVVSPHTHGLPAEGDLMAWRSADVGKTWSSGTVINDVSGAAREGLHAMAGDRQGNLFATWLDLRGSGTKLYGARSIDGGLTWSKNILVYESPDGSICQCCHPSVAMDQRGSIWVMWRNWLAGARDMYMVQSEDGTRFTKPQKLGSGTWPLNACPMDGGGISFGQERVVTAWRRGSGIFLAVPGQPETLIGEGKDVAVASGKTGAYAVWSQGAGLQMHVPHNNGPLALSDHGSDASLVATPNGGVLAAWEDDGGILVKALP